MTQKELIRQEIERRKNICEGIFERESDTYYQGKAVAYGELLAFIDSLPEEKPTLTVEDIKTILDISFWNNDPQKILEEYNRICDTSKVTPR